MNNKKTIFLIGYFIISMGIAAQPTNDNCAKAITLCSNQSVSASNINATAECSGADGDCLSSGSWAQCYDVDNSVWFSFTTNTTGGSASVTISNISCTLGDSLQGALLSATLLCSGSYISLDCNVGDSNSFSLSSTSLSPSTSYLVHIDGVNGAEGSFDIVVSGAAVDWSIATSSTGASCSADDGTATVTVNGGTSPYTYLWSDAKKQTTSTATALAAGSYTATVTDAGGCIDTIATVNVAQPNTPTANLSVNNITCTSFTGSITVNASGGTSPYTYSFNGATQSLKTYTTTTGGTYAVIVTDSKNCSYSDTVEVIDECIEKPIVVPDAFSPNGDDINDTWNIDFIDQYKSSKVFVYDRWGQKVYSSKGTYTPWDGTSLGYPVPAATYYYVIELINRNDEKITKVGYVAIVR